MKQSNGQIERQGTRNNAEAQFCLWIDRGLKDRLEILSQATNQTVTEILCRAAERYERALTQAIRRAVEQAEINFAAPATS